MIVIIISRWVLPKGGLSHDELSNLLFVYFAIASDIMELGIFEIFDKDDMCNVGDGILYAILGVWTGSMLQFTFPLSAKKKRKENNRKCIDRCCGWFCETEIWSLFLSVVLQDGPFFAVRLYCLVSYDMFSYEIIFFTMKNAMVVLLQIYRAIAVIKKRRRETLERKSALYALDSYSTLPYVTNADHSDTVPKRDSTVSAASTFTKEMEVYY